MVEQKQRFPGTRATAHTSETVQAGRTSLLQQTPRVLCNHKYIRMYVLAPMKGSIWDEMTCYVSYYSNRRTGVTACHCGVHVRIVCTALHYSLQLLLCWCLCSGFHEPSLHKNTYVCGSKLVLSALHREVSQVQCKPTTEAAAT